MQQLLDDYGAGVQIQGVAINQSVPPAAVNDAFHEVSAAQQQAQSYDQPGPRLCAAADRPGAGRGGRVREGLCRISRSRPK